MLDKFKITFNQLRRYPTTVILLVAVTIIQYLIQHTVRRSDASTMECMEQVEYLRIRVDKLEGQLDNYTRTVLFKDLQIKKQNQIIDSLFNHNKNVER